MERKNKKIDIVTSNDMQSGMNKLAEDMKKSRGYNLAGKVPKLGQEQHPSPRAGKPQPSGEFGLNMPDVWGVKKQKPILQKPIMQQQKPIEKEEQTEEDHYWSADEWEEWAYQIYETYPEMKKYLPEWFNKEMEEH